MKTVQGKKRCLVFVIAKNPACLSQLGIWWLQWYFPKQIQIMSYFINSFVFLHMLAAIISPTKSKAKAKVISDTYMYLPGRRLFLATCHCAGSLSLVLCKMKLLNHLISMVAPWKYQSTVLWLGTCKTYTPCFTPKVIDTHVFLSTTENKKWVLKDAERSHLENWY